MRRKESEIRRLVRLTEERLRGNISESEWRREIEGFIERSKSQQARENLKRLLRQIDSMYGKGRHPMVQGGLPELGKKR